MCSVTGWYLNGLPYIQGTLEGMQASGGKFCSAGNTECVWLTAVLKNDEE